MNNFEIVTSDDESISNSDSISNEFRVRRSALIEKLKNGEMSWSEYKNSLSPEELEYEKQCARERERRWYQTHKENAYKNNCEKSKNKSFNF